MVIGLLTLDLHFPGARSLKDKRQALRSLETRLRNRFKDPRIGFVTVTRVSLTADLRAARVFVGVLGEETQHAKTLAGLRQAAGFVRREMGKRVRIRHTPELIFQYDTGLDATDRVARLLDEARTPPAGDDEAD